MALRTFVRRYPVPAALLLAACSSSSSPAKVDGGGGPAPAGAICSSDSACAQNICLGGFCCAAPCNTTPGHPECSVCDSTGACVYPTVQCRPASCDPTALQASAAVRCDNGDCPSPQLTACAASCNGDVCGAGCQGDQDCAAGDRCVLVTDGGPASARLSGTCVTQLPAGSSCLTADDCQSGSCLAGTCCTSACVVDPGHPECTSCDQTGACVYPAAVCAAAHCDPVSNSYSTMATCHQGLCATVSSSACGAFQCSAAGCGTACVADGDCSPAAYCVLGATVGSCCPILLQGGTLYIDSLAGNDDVCCGASRDLPCQTLTHALAVAQISAAKIQQLGLTPLTQYRFELAVDGGAGDFQARVRGAKHQDAWPLTLPGGLTVHGPGVELGPLLLGDHTSQIVLLDGGYSVTLEGDRGAPLFLGITHSNSLSGATSFTGGGTLNLSNVAVFGGLVAVDNDFQAIAQMQINLGLDSDGGVGGPVLFGWDAVEGPLNGSSLIPSTVGLVLTALSSGGADGGDLRAVTDFGTAGSSVLRIYDQLLPDQLPLGTSTNFGLQIGGGWQVRLTHHPFIGGRGDAGYAGFIGVGNGGSLDLENAIIANQQYAGVMGVGGTTFLDGVQVTGNGCYGAWVTDTQASIGGPNSPFVAWQGENASGGGAPQADGLGGVFYAQNSVFTGNFVGVFQDGTQDESSCGASLGGVLTDLTHLPDGGVGGGNQLFCNGRAHAATSEFARCQPFVDGGPGADAWNAAVAPFIADRAAWGPQPVVRWSCDNLLQPTSCRSSAGPYCPNGTCASTALEAVTSPDLFCQDAGPLTTAFPTQAVTTCP